VPRVLLVGAAAARLADRFRALGVQTTTSADETGVYVVGIGSDARAALLHGTREGVHGVVGVDGRLPVEDAGAFRAPALVVSAEADREAAYAFAQALTDAGVLHETVVYDGVERGFFADDGHPEARADVWKLIRRFIGVPAAG
jgi:dienelactone hydrolase